MSTIFLQLVNISITAGWVVLAVILLRSLLKKTPKWINCLLWGIVGIRLVFPFSIESVFSLIPSKETITTTQYSSRPYIETGFMAVDKPINNYLGERYFEGVTVPTNHFANLTTILAIIWLLGTFIMLGYSIISYLRLKRNLRTATFLHDNVRQSEMVSSPFILGVIKPKIYLPYHLNETDIEYILAHEQAHLKRLDHLVKPFAFTILSIYWFHPLIWVAYILLCRDIELACDEKVIKTLEKDERKDYSRTLITNSINHRSIQACPLAFGEVGIKERVKTIMNYKKPTFWLLIIAAITCIGVTVCFLTNPKTINKEKIVITMLETHYSGNSESYAKITAKDSKGKVLWTYETIEYYPTDSVGVDIIRETKNQYIFNECGTIVSLDKKTGSVNWKNKDFGGRVRGIAIDESSGFYYLTGHYEPDLFIMDNNGKTMHKIPQFDPKYGSPQSIYLEKNFLNVKLSEGPTNQLSYTFRVDLTDYSYELVDNPPDENAHSSTYVSDEEHLLNDGKAYTTITARNDSGDSLWTYDTEEYEKEDLPTCKILAFVKNQCVFSLGNSITALDMENGKLVWKNENLVGYPLATPGFHKNIENIFLTCYDGPHFQMLDADGNIIHTIEKFASGYDNPIRIYRDNNDLDAVFVVLSKGPEGIGKYTFRIDLNDFSYELKEFQKGFYDEE